MRVSQRIRFLESQYVWWDCILLTNKNGYDQHEEYPLEAHFTRESWNGRMKAC